MLKIFIYIIPVVIVYILIVKKVKIKWKTFLEKGFKPNKNIYGIYCYCGKQGSGKTLSITEYCNDKVDKSTSKDILFMNLKSYNKKNYQYINNLRDLLKLRNRTDIVIVFDEIFTEISKLVKIDTQTAKDIMDFLSQMRKRRIILLTSCQEWRLLPLYFRLYCRYQINCRLIRVPFIGGILIKNIIDGDNIKWDEEEQDFVGELIENTISHTRLSVANSYDTYETISNIEPQKKQPQPNFSSFPSLDTDFLKSEVSIKEEIPTSSIVEKKEEFKKKQEDEISKEIYSWWGEDITPEEFLQMKKNMEEE